jgi:hypothetical protein
MAIVVSIAEITRRLATLGWTNINVSDVVSALATNNIPAASFIAYLDAVAAEPGGFNDQTIAGCSPTDANKITSALKVRGVEAV